MRHLLFTAFLFAALLHTAPLLDAQDTILFQNQIIRVGELDWDTHKDWRGKHFTIVEDTAIYGPDIRIYIGFSRKNTVDQIVFGYFRTDSSAPAEDFVAHGPARYYYRDGSLEGKRHFVHGRLNGPFEDYYFNGRIAGRCTYRNDTLHGEYITWYESGEVECRGTYISDRESGPQTCFHKNGSRKSWCNYVNGLTEGGDTSWYDNGRIESVYRFENGQEQDTAYHYHSDGHPFSARVFSDGRLTSVLYVKDNAGSPLPPGDFYNGNGRLNIYTDKGKLSEIVTYKNGYVKKVKYID